LSGAKSTAYYSTGVRKLRAIGDVCFQEIKPHHTQFDHPRVGN